jgi:hypothetical protein
LCGSTPITTVNSFSLFDSETGQSSSGQASIRAGAKLLSGHAGDP